MAVNPATTYKTNYSDTFPFSDTGAKIWLAANTEQTWTVPGDDTNQYRAKFRYNQNAEIWVKLNGTIVVPVIGNVVDSYNEELLPEVMFVKGGDVLHFISTGTPQIGVTLLSVPG